MVHLQKNTIAAKGNLFDHYSRNTNEKQSKYVYRGNNSINPNRTHLNYKLAPDQRPQGQILKERLSEVKVLKRKDVNVMCSILKKESNKTVSKLKKQDVKNELKMVLKKIDDVNRDIKPLEEEKISLEGEIESLKSIRDALTTEEIDSLQGQKILMSCLKVVSFKDYESENKAAAAEIKVQEILKVSKEEIEKARNEKPSLKLTMRLIELEGENDRLKTKLFEKETLANQLLKLIKRELPEMHAIITKPISKQNSLSHNHER